MNTRRGLLSVSCLKPNPNNPVVIFHSLSIASLTVATADRGRWIIRVSLYPLVATSPDSVPSSYLVRITIAPSGTTFGNLQWRRYKNNFTFEYSSNNNIFSFVAMSADSVPSSKTNIVQGKLYTLIYCRHFRTYSRCAMFDWSDTVFRRGNVTRRRISNTILQPRYWGSEADSPVVCRLR
jgi:hypothetical protein